jgi:hypothetical protein
MTSMFGISLYGLLLTVSVVLAVLGIVQFARRNLLWGGLLIVAALLIGPGGISIFG